MTEKSLSLTDFSKIDSVFADKEKGNHYMIKFISTMGQYKMAVFSDGDIKVVDLPNCSDYTYNKNLISV